jgi:hypothetical protein
MGGRSSPRYSPPRARHRHGTQTYVQAHTRTHTLSRTAADQGAATRHPLRPAPRRSCKSAVGTLQGPAWTRLDALFPEPQRPQPHVCYGRLARAHAARPPAASSPARGGRLCGARRRNLRLRRRRRVSRAARLAPSAATRPAKRRQRRWWRRLDGHRAGATRASQPSRAASPSRSEPQLRALTKPGHTSPVTQARSHRYLERLRLRQCPRCLPSGLAPSLLCLLPQSSSLLVLSEVGVALALPSPKAASAAAGWPVRTLGAARGAG